MNHHYQLTIKRALETLDPLTGGISEKPLFDHVELQVERRLTDLERASCLRIMTDHAWIVSSRHAFTDEIIYSITDSGRLAMIGL